MSFTYLSLPRILVSISAVLILLVVNPINTAVKAIHNITYFLYNIKSGINAERKINIVTMRLGSKLKEK